VQQRARVGLRGVSLAYACDTGPPSDRADEPEAGLRGKKNVACIGLQSLSDPLHTP